MNQEMSVQFFCVALYSSAIVPFEIVFFSLWEAAANRLPEADVDIWMFVYRSVLIYCGNFGMVFFHISY